MCLAESQITSTDENAMDPAVQAFAERMAIATRKSLADVLGAGSLDP